MSFRIYVCGQVALCVCLCRECFVVFFVCFLCVFLCGKSAKFFREACGPGPPTFLQKHGRPKFVSPRRGGVRAETPTLWSQGIDARFAISETCCDFETNRDGVLRVRFFRIGPSLSWLTGSRRLATERLFATSYHCRCDDNLLGCKNPGTTM